MSSHKARPSPPSPRFFIEKLTFRLLPASCFLWLIETPTTQSRRVFLASTTHTEKQVFCLLVRREKSACTLSGFLPLIRPYFRLLSSLRPLTKVIQQTHEIAPYYMNDLYLKNSIPPQQIKHAHLCFCMVPLAEYSPEAQPCHKRRSTTAEVNI